MSSPAEPPAFTPVFEVPESSLDDRWIPVRGNQVLLVDALDGLRPLTSDEADQIRDSMVEWIGQIVLGRFEDQPGHWFTAAIDADFDEFEAPFPGLVFQDLRSVMALLEPAVWNVAGRATQIIDWRRDNRYCGRCGAEMVAAPGERSMKCPVDGFTAYPRLSPATIVLVIDDQDRALLARNVNWPMPMYSTLAGFVEPGESLEGSIHREIAEEVGIAVNSVEYFGSQPWPFPNSLMLGFFAHYAGGDIVCDPTEIADAQWFGRDSLPMIPPHGSIARALIDQWLNGSVAE